MKAAELEALGRRAVACSRWRWMPGMAVLRYAPGTPAHGQQQARVDDDAVTYEQALGVHIMPDLADPATLGCLLALVRKAWGRPFWIEGDSRSMGERPDEWIGVLFEGRFATCPIVHASTEAEALVAALEAAP